MGTVEKDQVMTGYTKKILTRDELEEKLRRTSTKSGRRKTAIKQLQRSYLIVLAENNKLNRHSVEQDEAIRHWVRRCQELGAELKMARSLKSAYTFLQFSCGVVVGMGLTLFLGQVF